MGSGRESLAQAGMFDGDGLEEGAGSMEKLLRPLESFFGIVEESMAGNFGGVGCRVRGDRERAVANVFGASPTKIALKMYWSLVMTISVPRLSPLVLVAEW